MQPFKITLVHSLSPLHMALTIPLRSPAPYWSKQNFSPSHLLQLTTLPTAALPTSTRTCSRHALASLRASYSPLHFPSSAMSEDLFMYTGYLAMLALLGMNTLISWPAKHSSRPLLTPATQPDPPPPPLPTLADLLASRCASLYSTRILLLVSKQLFDRPKYTHFTHTLDSHLFRCILDTHFLSAYAA
uniref:Putative secreted protein n=1 Tax=Ixodes ricinus TaxID=34613 RepID=A0A6B0UZX4_IXORI